MTENQILAKTDVARRGDASMLAVLNAYQDDLGAIMPSHVNAETFVGLAMAYVRRDRNLSMAAASNPLSLVIALREVAALGHVPMKGVCALVPYQSKKKEDNGWNITAIEEVGGVLQRIYRAGGVTTVHCDVVRQNDKARFQRTSMILPYHEYDEFVDPAERGPLIAVYAYATLLNGQPSTVVWMPKGTVLKHRASSRSGDAFWGPPWPGEGPWTEDMWKKTAIHKLSTLVPASAEYRWQLAASEAAAAARFQGVPDRPSSVETGGGTDFIEGYATAAPADAEGVNEWPETREPGSGAVA